KNTENRVDIMHNSIEDTLAIVNMSDYRLTEPYRLSGGQKQRIAIAGVLAIEPKLMVLDEATAMLDPRGRREIMQTITHIKTKQSLSLITITHDLNEIKHAERVIVINEGQIWTEAIILEIFSKTYDLYNILIDDTIV